MDQKVIAAQITVAEAKLAALSTERDAYHVRMGQLKAHCEQRLHEWQDKLDGYLLRQDKREKLFDRQQAELEAELCELRGRVAPAGQGLGLSIEDAPAVLSAEGR